VVAAEKNGENLDFYNLPWTKLWNVCLLSNFTSSPISGAFFDAMNKQLEPIQQVSFLSCYCCFSLRWFDVVRCRRVHSLLPSSFCFSARWRSVICQVSWYSEVDHSQSPPCILFCCLREHDNGYLRCTVSSSVGDHFFFFFFLGRARGLTKRALPFAYLSRFPVPFDVNLLSFFAGQLLDLLEAHILRPRQTQADPYNNPAIVGTYARLLYAAPYSYS
jgi:hypothetical protein